MDLRGIPVIDTHCHPFYPEQGEISAQLLRDAVSVSLRGETVPDNTTMLLSRMVIKQLARVLDCQPDWDSVMEARNARASIDPAAYNRALFEEANIAMLLIDPGFPPQREITAEQFELALPCPVVQGYRIERFMGWGSLHEIGFASFDQFLEAFLDKLDAEAALPRTRFFKTVIAYRTGLAIRKVSEGQARDAWSRHELPRDEHDKVIRDYLFWRTAEKARDYGIPFQVHTGHTSQTNVWPDTNPILLTPLLNEPEMQDIQFVLVHGGYPYCTEAGYMTSVYGNVALDLSLMIPWSSIGIAQRIWQTLEAAPTSRVMYGSDGIWVPELYWISALNGRKALGSVLETLTRDDVLDEAEAMEVAEDILYRNAVRIYRLEGDLKS